MRGFVGTSQNTNIEEAIEQATKGLKKADLLVLIAPFKMAEKAADALSEKYPGTPMIGTTSASYAKGNTSDSMITVIGFAGISVATGIISDIRKTPVNYVYDYESALNSIEPESSNTLCLEFTGGNEEKVIATMNSVLRRYDIPLAGSTAYGTPLGEKPLVILNGKAYTNSCVYAFIKNNNGNIHLLKENLYKKLSKKAHFATLIDTNTKTLFQLDERPAHEVYTEETGVEKENIVENMLINPLGRAIGEEIYLTTTTSLDMNGVMFNGKAIFNNESIFIMQPRELSEVTEETMNTIHELTEKTSFTLCIDSVNRLRYIATQDYLEDFFLQLNSLGSYVGILGQGEQFYNQHINQTLVMIVFE